MARPPEGTLTGREAQIMDALWQLGEATADQVRETLPEPLHDSTVRTLLRVLESKGYWSTRPEARPMSTGPWSVGRRRSDGRWGACWRGSSAGRPRTWSCG